jgi:hypothetical protein
MFCGYWTGLSPRSVRSSGARGGDEHSGEGQRAGPARPGSTTLYNSIFWFDDDMLVVTHAYGVPANFAPALHLRRLSSGTLFQTYARSFDRVWDQTHKTFTGKEKM